MFSGILNIKLFVGSTIMLFNDLDDIAFKPGIFQLFLNGVLVALRSRERKTWVPT